MTRKNLAARLSPQQDLRENLRTAADLGLGGVIIEAIGPMSPSELSRTGRREVRALLNSGALALDALALPARRTIADIDQWEDRLARMRFAMEMAYELGTRRVCVAPGAVPADDKNRSLFVDHLKQLADVAERHGISLSCEAGLDPFLQLVETITGMKHPSLSISLDPGRLRVRTLRRRQSRRMPCWDSYMRQTPNFWGWASVEAVNASTGNAFGTFSKKSAIAADGSSGPKRRWTSFRS